MGQTVKFLRGSMTDFLRVFNGVETCKVEEVRMSADGRLFFITDNNYIDLNDNLLYNISKDKDEMKIQPLYEEEENIFLQGI